MKAQALRDASQQQMMSSKKTMEINPQHPIVRMLVAKTAESTTDSTVKDLVWLLYDCALLDSGFSLPKPTGFTSRIHRLIALGLGVEGGEEDDLPDDDLVEVEAPGEEEGEDAAGSMEEVD